MIPPARKATLTTISISISAACVLMPGCTSAPSPALATQPTNQLVELSDSVRVNLTDRYVEFDAEAVAIEDPDVTVPLYLELAVCLWNTKEHESLFATAARPSNIHAGLLLLDARPGSPGFYQEDLPGQFTPVQPTGQPVNVTVHWQTADDEPKHAPITRFISIDPEAQRPINPAELEWVFAGSRVVTPRTLDREFYEADITGTIVGLSSFGSEVIAPTVFHSPELAIEPALWTADFEYTLPPRTAVTIRISPMPNTVHNSPR